MNVTRESYTEAYRENPEIFSATSNEVLSGVPHNHAWVSKTEQSGNIRFYVARDEAKNILGYWCLHIGITPITGCVKCANNLGIYVSPKYRKTMAGVGAKLMRFAELDMKEDGVRKVKIGSRKDHDISSSIGSLGYLPVETILEKQL